MKLKRSVTLLALLAAMIGVVFCAFADNSEAEKCIEFLSGYGWEVEEKPSDSAAVNIPKTFDRVYEGYNEIQRAAGLNLEAFLGRSGTRYTFVVTNYPIDVGEPVYANVICIGGEPVAGDIMTVSINGFMHSLGQQDFTY